MPRQMDLAGWCARLTPAYGRPADRRLVKLAEWKLSPISSQRDGKRSSISFHVFFFYVQSGQKQLKCNCSPYNIYKSPMTSKYCRENVIGRVGSPTHHGVKRTCREKTSHHLQCVGIGEWVLGFPLFWQPWWTSREEVVMQKHIRCVKQNNWYEAWSDEPESVLPSMSQKKRLVKRPEIYRICGACYTRIYLLLPVPLSLSLGHASG